MTYFERLSLSDDKSDVFAFAPNQARRRTKWLWRGVAAIRACYKIFRANTVVTPTSIERYTTSCASVPRRTATGAWCVCQPGWCGTECGASTSSARTERNERDERDRNHSASNPATRACNTAGCTSLATSGKPTFNPTRLNTPRRNGRAMATLWSLTCSIRLK